MTARKIAAALALLSVAAAASAQTAEAPTSPQPSATPVDTTTDGLSARRVVRDRATGQLRAPTAEEAEAMRSAQPQAAVKAGPKAVRQHASGMRSAVLGRDYLVTLRGTRQADGTIRPSHLHADAEKPVVRDDRPTE